MRPRNTVPIAFAFVLISVVLVAQPAAEPFKVMITEISWGEPDGVEITNFGVAPLNLQGWTVLWRDAAGVQVSAPLNVTLAPGALLVVLEQNGIPAPEIPAPTLQLPLLPPLATTTESIAVALADPLLVIVDEVLVTDTGGAAGTSLGGAFRGHARRGTLLPSLSVERIWGLDSDGGLDWSEEQQRSFGLENRSSGARNGVDTIAIPTVWLNEIDADPDFIELVNRGTSSVALQGAFLLISDVQGSALRRVNPWPAPFSLGVGRYCVLGETPVPPPELPGSATYVPLASGALGLGTGEFTVGLYDRLGRALDVVRATDEIGGVVHNHPRVPSWPFDFTGAAPRLLAGDRALGRPATAVTETNTGGDWTAFVTRSMGGANTVPVGALGHFDRFDVRLNEGEGLGMSVILNAGATSAGHTYSFFFSLGHVDGLGPFFGLGPDALFNWLLFGAVPPFSGLLDARGSARYDFAPGSMPPGFNADCVFILQTTAGAISKRTLILEFDT